MSTQGSKAMNETIDNCRHSSVRISTIAMRIYNTIRYVGRGTLSADNALHIMIEDYKDLCDISKDINNIANEIVKMQLEETE